MGLSVLLVSLRAFIELTHFTLANSSSKANTNTGSTYLDDLPPFASLMTDGDREKKAERSGPGTYNVVVNQDSFNCLPEYGNDDEGRRKRKLSSASRRGSPAAPVASNTHHSTMEEVVVPGDPNIIILPRFKEPVRRGRRIRQLPLPLVDKNAILKGDKQDEATVSQEDSVDDIDSIDQHPEYLIQFRNAVWRQLVPTEQAQGDGPGGSSVDILEAEAKVFPPVRYSNF